MTTKGYVGLILGLTLLGLIGVGAFIGYKAHGQTVTTPAVAAAVCAYSSSPPTVSTGNFVLLQCDSTGKIAVKP